MNRGNLRRHDAVGYQFVEALVIALDDVVGQGKQQLARI